jgi:PLD-like domain
MFLSGKGIADAIGAALSTATGGADFAVAYWGKGSMKRLGLDSFNGKIRIICDLWSLSCNPNELQKLLDRNFKLKTKDGLHAKVYLTSNKIVIGSANASINGLGEEDKNEDNNHELEAAIVSEDDDIICAANKWFERHWKAAKTIDKDLLDEVRPFWKRRKRSFNDYNLLSILSDDVKPIGRLPLRLTVFESENEQEYVDAWKMLSARYSQDEIKKHNWDGSNHPFYLDYSGQFKVDPDSYFIDYWAEQVSVGSFKFKRDDGGGLWRVRESQIIEINGKKVQAILCDLVKEIHHFQFPDKDWEMLGLCIKDYLRRNKISKRHVLLDVQLKRLPVKYPTIFKNLKRRLVLKSKPRA